MIIRENNLSALIGLGFVVESNGRVVPIAEWAREQPRILAQKEQEKQKTPIFVRGFVQIKRVQVVPV